MPRHPLSACFSVVFWNSYAHANGRRQTNRNQHSATAAEGSDDKKSSSWFVGGVPGLVSRLGRRPTLQPPHGSRLFTTGVVKEP